MLKTKSLADRIKEVQDEANALIDKRVEELRKDYSFPPTMLRRDIEMKAWGCPCEQYKKMVEQK